MMQNYGNTGPVGRDVFENTGPLAMRPAMMPAFAPALHAGNLARRAQALLNIGKRH